MSVRLREARVGDLEIMLAWRNHPKVYEWSYTQDGPLSWTEHREWWESREDRHDWIIEVQDNRDTRDVGTACATNLDSGRPDIGVIVGEIPLWGHGVGRRAISEACQILADIGYTEARARIMKENDASIVAFSKAGFRRVGEAREGEWDFRRTLEGDDR